MSLQMCRNDVYMQTNTSTGAAFAAFSVETPRRCLRLSISEIHADR